MGGLSWVELAFLLPFTMVAFAFLAFLMWLIFTKNDHVGSGQPSASPPAAKPAASLPLTIGGLSPALRLLLVGPLLVGLGLAAVLAALHFGSEAFERAPAWSVVAGIAILCIVGLLLFVVVASAIMIGRRHGQPSARLATPSWTPLAASHDADERLTIIARLTQRFCPQCRTALAADAPEGLCPACLMARGLASGVRNATEGVPYSAYAATTPPSGSQPPASGEWADLQQHFPELEILELLGRGGMGAVYKARQKNLDRLVALKVIPPEAAKDPAFTERFNREARAMARLNHPNIVTVYNFGQEGDLCWLLMEYVDGVNLRHTLRASRLQPQEALAIVPQICDALQYAHDQGVVHRDIKPENVLLDRSGRVKIADFGLAKLLGKGPDDFTLTRTQQVMGTPRYMAPEQIDKPSTVDHRADIYSLGVVIYEMLTGELPMGQFAPPSEKVQVDVRIDQIVLRALAREPERRYQRASQVKTELASANSWSPAAAESPAAPESPSLPSLLAGEGPGVRGRAFPPTWHTPAPATKDRSSSQTFGELPPAEVLGVAVGMVLGLLIIGGGIAAGIYGLVNFRVFDGDWWGWVGGGFGCVIGGCGSLFGSYNTYRQMAGAEDLMRSPNVTWFDWVMRGYFVLGILLVVASMPRFAAGDMQSFWAMVLLGGIVTFQATLFLLWRMLIRPRAAAGTHLPTRSERSIPAEPGYWQGVVGPAAILFAVWLLMAVDVHYATPTRRSAQTMTQQLQPVFYDNWLKAIVGSGMVAIPLCLLVLGAWRTWGPRVTGPDGQWRVPYPFAGRGWPIAVGVLAALTLVMPWFRLEVAPNAEASLRLGELFAPPVVGGGAAPEAQFAVMSREHLESIAMIGPGGRYIHRGIQDAVMGPAALLLLCGAVLTAVARGAARATRGLLLAGFGASALLLIVLCLHNAARLEPTFIIDGITEEGLYSFVQSHLGSRPHSVRPLFAALRDCFVVQPAIGLWTALAATCLAIFLGVTELCWGTTPVDAAEPARAKPEPLCWPASEEDPARAALRRRVAGPATGLMIAGFLGLLPELLAVLIVPAFIAVRVDEVPSPESLSVPGSAALPIAAAMGPLALPLLLAQEGPPPVDFVLGGIWIVVLLVNLVFSATILVGGWRMRQLKSHGLALIAAVLAMLPCTLGWMLGLPIGIWALSVLREPEVREAFES